MPDMENIEQLFRQHYLPMYRMARALLKDDEGGKDVVSDIFADIIRGDIVLRNEPVPDAEARMRGFLLRCTRNRCLNQLSRLAVGERVARLLALEATPSLMPAEPPANRLDAILDYIDHRLTPQTRQVIRMRFCHKLKYREIAEQLDISEVAVYKHLSKGIKQLQEQFNP